MRRQTSGFFAGIGLSLLMTPNGVFAEVSESLWLRHWQALKSEFVLPLEDSLERLEIPDDIVSARIEKSVSQADVEPIYVRLPGDMEALREASTRYAAEGNEKTLYRLFAENLLEEEDKVRLTPEMHKLLRPETVKTLFLTKHHRLLLPTASLIRDPELRTYFTQQLQPFFRLDERQKIYAKLYRNQVMSVDKDLLPEFARKMVGRYIIYRGPNCFHAALAFQNPFLTRSKLFNVKAEKGYHGAMINYDELWRTLQKNFYEVNPREAPVKYGDVLVFFDLPAGKRGPISHRWIKHAATFLFNDYTFSKGSKSPNTAYSVKRLGEEWQTWHHLCKNLAVKVFRRSSKHVRKRPPIDLNDWIY